jgi:hypothetical protein
MNGKRCTQRSIVMFKFRIRELLLVMSIVGLALGWSLDHATLLASKSSLTREMKQWRFRCAYIATYVESDCFVHWDETGIGVQRKGGGIDYAAYPWPATVLSPTERWPATSGEP